MLTVPLWALPLVVVSKPAASTTETVPVYPDDADPVASLGVTDKASVTVTTAVLTWSTPDASVVVKVIVSVPTNPELEV